MIGDTPYDVKAATHAGVRIIGVRCGGWGDDELSGAVAVYDDPKDLLDQYSSSVIGTGVRARASMQERKGTDQQDRRAMRSAEEERHGHGA